MDAATNIDITCLSLNFPPIDDEEGWVIIPWFWIPANSIEGRSRRDKVPYDAWARDGWLTTIPGDRFDKSFVRRFILDEIASVFQLVALGFDPWNAEWVNQEIGNEDGLLVVRVEQSLRNLNSAAKEFEARVVDGTLLHGGNPIARWMANNVSVYMDGNGNFRPDKKKSTERIDFISATVSAIAVELAGVEPAVVDSWYNTNVIEAG